MPERMNKMAEYIEKNTLYEKMADLEVLARNRYLDTPSNSPAYSRYMAQLNERTRLKHMIADFPAADVAPVKHGKWVDGVDCYKPILMEPYEMVTHLICSNCNEIWFNPECHPNYCPNCGAKMDLEGKEESE